MIEVTEHTLDVERLLCSKLGAKSSRVPKFIVRWLTKLIHQDELNDFLWQSKGLVGSAWLKACIAYLGNKIEVRGLDNLPSPDDPKRYTFVGNHPLGGIDGVAIGSVIGERYNDNFKYIVNDLLMNLPGLAPLCIPVNTAGKKGRGLPALIEAGFNSDSHIVMFPAGLCSRKIDGEIHDLPWQKTFIVKSVKTQRDVVPMHFSGRNSERFYRIANICKLLHLKVNIAMLYLVDEMFLNRGKTFTVTFGKPIPWQTFDKTRTPKEWAKYVEDLVYELPKETGI